MKDTEMSVCAPACLGDKSNVESFSIPIDGVKTLTGSTTPLPESAILSLKESMADEVFLIPNIGARNIKERGTVM